MPTYPDTVDELLSGRKAGKDAEAAILAGDEAVRQGDLELARKRYSKALQLHPEYYDAIVGLEYVDYLASGRKSRYHWPRTIVAPDIHSLRKENWELNQAEFRAGKTLLQSRPAMCFIEVTTKCNFHCPHCTKGYSPYYGADIPADVTELALDQLFPKLVWATITGFGEPTISSEYNAIMARLAENQIIAHYSTNTSTLTLPHIEQLVKCSANVILSVDGASRKTFETIRRGGSWDRFLHSLHAISRIRSIFPFVDSPDVVPGERKFRITFVAMRMNVHELPDMVRLVHAFGLDDLTVHDYQPLGGAEFDKQSLRNGPDRANDYLNQAEALARELGVKLNLPDRYVAGAPIPGESLLAKAWNAIKKGQIFPERNRFPKRCNHPWNDVAIWVDGKVGPCCFSTRILGDLKKKSFARIWNGWRYRMFRKRIDTFFPPVECRNCHVNEGINHGNPGATKSKEGLLLKVLYYFELRLYNWRRTRKDRNRKPNYSKGRRWKPDLA